MTRMSVSLVTLGDPNKQTGGYLYHRRLAELAPQHAARMTFASLPDHPFPVPAAFAPSILRDIRGTDVVVVDSIVAAALAPWLNRISAPKVGMLHQKPGGIDHGPIRSALQTRLDLWAYGQMRTLLVASESLRDRLSGHHPDIRVVPPGRDVAARAEAVDLDLRRGRGAAFLCVANWLPRKGVDILLDAFALLPATAATLHLVGDPDPHPRFAARVGRRLELLGDRVVVHGIVSKERVAAMYGAADVFVMPSFEEPYGTVYGEAMAAGLPVVGWRAGNLPYLAEDGVEALIVDPGDVAALASALRLLAENETLRKELGEAARSRAEGFPTWNETARTFFSALRGIR